MQKTYKKNSYNKEAFKKTTNKPNPQNKEYAMGQTPHYIFQLPVTEKEKRNNTYSDFNIEGFYTSPDYMLHNLPRIEQNSYNFAYTESALNAMLQKPKVLISLNTHLTKDKMGKDLFINKFYMITPDLPKENDINIPVIYRLDVLMHTNNKDFFGIKGQAVVGGCRDGFCTLFEITSDREGGPANFSYPKAYNGFYKTERRTWETEKLANGENILPTVANFVFNLLNITSIQAYDINCEKIFDMAKSFKENKDLTKSITGEEFIEKFLYSQPLPDDPHQGFISNEFTAHNNTMQLKK